MKANKNLFLQELSKYSINLAHSGTLRCFTSRAHRSRDFFFIVQDAFANFRIVWYFIQNTIPGTCNNKITYVKTCDQFCFVS